MDDVGKLPHQCEKIYWLIFASTQLVKTYFSDFSGYLGPKENP